jgi:gamma-glutamylputrescine oxidase
MSTSFWLDRSAVAGKKTYDVVVIGAGITGLSTAYWLQKEDPSLKIAILEKNRFAFGASGRNAGFITCGSVEHFSRMISKHGLERAVEIWKFSETNLRLLQEEIIQENTERVSFEKKGAFSLAATEPEFAELKKTSNIMTDLKIPSEILEGDAVLKRLGAINFVGGIKYLDDASANPVALLQEMRAKIQGDLF